MRKLRCPQRGLSWLHPSQGQSALRAQSVGQAQSPGVMGGGRGQQSPSASSRDFHSAAPGPGRGRAPCCGHTSPPNRCPQTSSQVPSQAATEAETRRPHLRPSLLLSLHIHSLCFSGEAAERRLRNGSPAQPMARCHRLMQTSQSCLRELTGPAWCGAGRASPAPSEWGSEQTD